MPMTDEEIAARTLGQLKEGYDLIPYHMHGAIERYVLKGIPPGSFLEALLSNNFMEAVGRADSDNLHALVGWAKFFYNHMPASSYGSPQNVTSWYARFNSPEKD